MGVTNRENLHVSKWQLTLVPCHQQFEGTYQSLATTPGGGGGGGGVAYITLATPNQLVGYMTPYHTYHHLCDAGEQSQIPKLTPVIKPTHVIPTYPLPAKYPVYPIAT